MKIFTAITLALSLCLGCAGSSTQKSQERISYFTLDEKPITQSSDTTRLAGSLNDTLPSVVKKVEPVYPVLAIRAGLEGDVTVKMWIGSDGKPTKVIALRVSAEPFMQSTIEAAKQWVFRPLIKNGHEETFIVTLNFRYEISNGPKIILPD